MIFQFNVIRTNQIMKNGNFSNWHCTRYLWYCLFVSIPYILMVYTHLVGKYFLAKSDISKEATILYILNYCCGQQMMVCGWPIFLMLEIQCSFYLVYDYFLFVVFLCSYSSLKSCFFIFPEKSLWQILIYENLFNILLLTLCIRFLYLISTSL